MKKQLLATAVLAALSLNVAQAYQAELGASLGYANVNSSPDHATAYSAGVSATGYLDNVSTRNGPLAEAGFINHASNGTVSYNYAQSKQTGFEDLKTQELGVNAEYYVPQSILYLSANGAVNHVNVHGEDYSTYGAEIGVLPIPNLLLTVGVASVDTKTHTDNDPTIRAKWLTQLSTGNSLNLEGNARFGNNSDSYGVNADFYLDRTFSIGAGYDVARIKGVDNNPYAVNINARKFITHDFSVAVIASTGKTISNDNIYGVGLNGVLRF